MSKSVASFNEYNCNMEMKKDRKLRKKLIEVTEAMLLNYSMLYVVIHMSFSNNRIKESV
jgi:hypothetical protein